MLLAVHARMPARGAHAADGRTDGRTGLGRAALWHLHVAWPACARDLTDGRVSDEQLFGIWRGAGKHHRIDIVVCSFPEELPFALLGWTGSRLLNRLMRQLALKRDLYLSSHALVAKQRVTVRVEGGRDVVVPALQEVPYEHVRTERAILRILAGGTDDFKALDSAKMRNC